MRVAGKTGAPAPLGDVSTKISKSSVDREGETSRTWEEVEKPVQNRTHGAMPLAGRDVGTHMFLLLHAERRKRRRDGDQSPVRMGWKGAGKGEEGEPSSSKEEGGSFRVSTCMDILSL